MFLQSGLCIMHNMLHNLPQRHRNCDPYKDTSDHNLLIVFIESRAEGAHQKDGHKDEDGECVQADDQGPYPESPFAEAIATAFQRHFCWNLHYCLIISCSLWRLFEMDFDSCQVNSQVGQPILVRLCLTSFEVWVLKRNVKWKLNLLSFVDLRFVAIGGK